MLATILALQLISSAVPLPDKDGDGRIELQTTAAAFKVPRGTIVDYCPGTAYLYRYGKATCPAPAQDNAIRPPVVTVQCIELGASRQWGYYGAAGSYGNACFTLSLDLVPLGAGTAPRTFHDIRSTGSRTFITTRGRYGGASSNVTVQRIEATARKYGIYLRDGSSDWTIEDFRIAGSGINTSPGDIPAGIVMDGAHRITIRRGEVSGFKSEFSGGYPNADCISGERGDDFSATDVLVHDCTDGGIDTKADTTLDRITAERIGRYSFRFWGNVEAGALTSINPGKAHIQVASTSTRAHVAKLIAVGPAPLVTVDSHAKDFGEIVIDACDLSRWTGTALVTGVKAKVTFGAGCVLR